MKRSDRPLRWPVAAAMIAALALSLSACGSSGTSSSTDASVTPAPNRSLQLLDYLPADSPLVVAADLGAATKEFGLPANNDPFQFAGPNANLQDPTTQLSFIANATFGPLEQAFEQQKLTPIVDAIDGSAVEASATNLLATTDPVSVIRTSQPFSEIAGALEKAGFKRKGSALVATKPRPNQYTSVASAGSGIVVVAAGKADAGQLASSPPGGPKPLRQLLAPADLPVAVAIAGPPGSCVTALGGWSETGRSGTLRLTVDGPASVDALNADVLQGSVIDPGTPKVAGTSIEVPFSAGASDALQAASPLQALVVNVSPKQLYDCPAGG